MTKPKLRFKEFNDKWINTNIKNISLLLKDGTHGSYNDTIDGIPLLSAKDIENGKIQIPCDCRRISLKDYNDIFKNYKLEINDILLTIVGTIGRLAIIENTTEKYAFQRSVAIIRINQENNPKFILYILQTNNVKKQFYARVNQSAQGGIYLDTLGKTNIVLPCFEEQEKIAGFLSKVDEFINECEGEVKDLEEQKKGLMQKIFSQQIRFKDSNNKPYPDWEEHCINEFIISLKSGLSRELQNEDIGIPVIRANNTYNGIVGGNDIKYWYKKDPKGANIDNYVLDDRDILINFINSLPRMGEAAIYTNFLNRPCIYTTNLLRLKLNNKLNYKYFFYYTKTSEYINYIKAITKLAVNQASFTTVDFKNMKLLLPCLEEQEKIAKVLSKMDELIEEKKALLSDWQQFKKGLLQQMFV